MYDLIGYGSMIADSVRTEAYARALRDAVNPDSAVLDIGTGTGLLALLACRYGARRVYAVEPSDAIALAREIARANGYAERITFIQGMSERVTLPEPVDIIVSDIRGVLPLCQRSVQSVLDARRRLLAPGGILIPGRDLLMVALIDAPNLYEKHALPWDAPIHGLDMTAARRFVNNTWHNGRATPEQLLVAPKRWGELDYATFESPDVRGDVSWTAERTGIAHGLSVWFDSKLAPGAAFSNAPDHPRLIYGSGFFPLSEPVAVNEGDRINVSLRADLVGEDYTWSWNTKIRASECSEEVRADFKQSSFYSSPMLQAELHKRAANHRPTLTEDGEIALQILQLMHEKCTLEHIARQICARFPARFPDWPAALGHVGAFSSDYSGTAE
ncbi:MAG: methyltransferase domain-containing protein [Gammaproteobacteria bacterium]|jgi:protein arginine N-methyltransferase 1|nr:methyltransferase domain-containing protein [Gammaproteobacteria bacterium]